MTWEIIRERRKKSTWVPTYSTLSTVHPSHQVTTCTKPVRLETFSHFSVFETGEAERVYIVTYHPYIYPYNVHKVREYKIQSRHARSLSPSLSPFFSLAKRNGPERRDSRETQIHTLSSLALHGGKGGGKVSIMLACLSLLWWHWHGF